MNLSLGSRWEDYVAAKVKSGDYQSASEVVRDGLRLLEKEELLKRISFSSMADLEAKLLQAAAEIDAGNFFDGEEVFAELRQHSKARRGKS